MDKETKMLLKNSKEDIETLFSLILDYSQEKGDIFESEDELELTYILEEILEYKGLLATIKRLSVIIQGQRDKDDTTLYESAREVKKYLIKQKDRTKEVITQMIEEL